MTAVVVVVDAVDDSSNFRGSSFEITVVVDEDVGKRLLLLLTLWGRSRWERRKIDRVTAWRSGRVSGYRIV